MSAAVWRKEMEQTEKAIAFELGVEKGRQPYRKPSLIRYAQGWAIIQKMKREKLCFSE